MASPILELQGEIVARLKGYAPLTALVGPRVYDEVPAEAVFPYVSLGPTDEIENDADCIEAVDVTFQIDVWSRASGTPEMRRIADAVRRALHQHEADLPANALTSLEHRITRTVRDPDGLTNHAAIEFAATIEITTSP